MADSIQLLVSTVHHQVLAKLGCVYQIVAAVGDHCLVASLQCIDSWLSSAATRHLSGKDVTYPEHDFTSLLIIICVAIISCQLLLASTHLLVRQIFQLVLFLPTQVNYGFTPEALSKDISSPLHWTGNHSLVTSYCTHIYYRDSKEGEDDSHHHLVQQKII